MNSSNVDIIVARYNETLDWTLESPFNEFKYIVYNKGNNDNFEKKNVKQIIQLDNVGRCDHTYLYHIVKNFDNLNTILVFFPGSINMGIKKDKARMLLEKLKKNNCTNTVFMAHYEPNGILNSFFNFSLDRWSASESNNFVKNNESKLDLSKLRPYGKWFLYNFGNINVKYYNYHGIFSIHKEDVIKHLKIRFERILQDVSSHSNPEVGHYIERSWGAIFYPLTKTKIFITPV